MDYEKLKLKKYRPAFIRSDRPVISISRTGFRFNTASEKYMNRHYKYCELFYDKDEMVIAFRPTNGMTESTFKISRTAKGNPVICGKNFLKQTGLDELLKLPNDHKGIRALPAWDEKRRMFLLDVKSLKRGENERV